MILSFSQLLFAFALIDFIYLVAYLVIFECVNRLLADLHRFIIYEDILSYFDSIIS